ncbi:hypothetical protein DWB64_14770 [Fusibacter sp. A1]|nr:hypothetical protein DWB64_14770 [Fusibacter sp. A1]
MSKKTLLAIASILLFATIVIYINTPKMYVRSFETLESLNAANTPYQFSTFNSQIKISSIDYYDDSFTSPYVKFKCTIDGSCLQYIVGGNFTVDSEGTEVRYKNSTYVLYAHNDYTNSSLFNGQYIVKWVNKLNTINSPVGGIVYSYLVFDTPYDTNEILSLTDLFE